MLLKSSKRILLALVSIALLTSGAFAGQKYEIGHLDFPPYYLMEKGKPAGGHFHDLLLETAGTAGLDVYTKAYPTKRLYSNIVKGKTNIFLGVKGASAYHSDVIYSKTRITTVEVRAFFIGDKTKINAPKEIVGKNLILIRGYSYGGFLAKMKGMAKKKMLKLNFADGHKNAFKMLKKGRGDYVLDYKRPAMNALKEMKPIKGISYSVAAQVPGYFIVSKKTPKAQELMDKLDAAYLKKHSVDEYQRH